MKITILNGGHRSIELPLSDEELNFQMRQMGIRETIPKGKLVKVSEKDNPLQKLEGQFLNMDEVNFFARRMEHLTEYERKVLAVYANDCDVSTMCTRIQKRNKYGTNAKWKCKGYLYRKQEKCRDRTITDDQLKQVCVDAINAVIQNGGLLYRKDPEDVISPEYRRMDRKIAEMKEKAVPEKEFIQALYQRAEERYRTLTVKDTLYKTEEIRDIVTEREKIVEFDRELYQKLILKIYLCSGNMAEVEFLNGGRMKVGYTDKKPGREANGCNS